MEAHLLTTESGTAFYRYMGRGRVFTSECHIWEVWCQRQDGRLVTLSSCFPTRYGFARSLEEARVDALALVRTGAAVAEGPQDA